MGAQLTIPGIVDSHCHAAELWYEPVDVLLFQMDRCGVERAVLTQLYGFFDNSYQQSCVEAHPDRLASVVGIDAREGNACEQLERLVADGAVGVRLPARDRSPGEDPLAIWRTAERLGISVSIPLVPNKSEEERAEFAALLAAVPRLPIVLEHLGGPRAPLGREDLDERAHSFALSRFPNVYMKFGGTAEIADKAGSIAPGRLFEPPIPRYHMTAYEAFGAARLMWGSNFPPVAQQEGYLGSLESAADSFQGVPPSEMEQMFSGTAKDLYFSASTP